MSALTWQPWNMCGVQALLDDGQTVTVDGFQQGCRSGFVLSYRFGLYHFTSRDDAYEAAELLNTALYLQREGVSK